MYTRAWSKYFPESSVGLPSFVTEHHLWDDRQTEAAKEIEAGLDEIEYVRLVFVDPHGLARSKVLPAGCFRTVLRNGMDFSPGPFLFDTGEAVAVEFLGNTPGVAIREIAGAGDFVVVPDPTTFQLLPDLEPKTAWVLGDEYLRDGSPHPLATRRVLRRVCAEFAERSLTPIVGLEVEWYLTRLLDGPPGNLGNGFGRQGSAPIVQAVNAGYQFNLDQYMDSIAPVTDPLSAMLLALRLPLRSIEHESGPGQVEMTFGPMQALDSADAMILFRMLAKQTATRRGFHASFMALPGLDSFDPSGWHLHQSVLVNPTGSNLFAPQDGTSGMSTEGKAYIDGLLGRAREFCMLSVPTVNGYRRLSPDFVLSPTRVNTNVEDRSVMVRVLGSNGSTHIENRVGEPCANPYLTIASQMFAGLEGLFPDQFGEPDPRSTECHSGPSEEVLPQSLDEALRVFRNSRAAQELLGDPLVSCLVKLKESEVARFAAWSADQQLCDGAVTDWEQREYFRIF